MRTQWVKDRVVTRTQDSWQPSQGLYWALVIWVRTGYHEGNAGVQVRTLVLKSQIFLWVILGVELTFLVLWFPHLENATHNDLLPTYPMGFWDEHGWMYVERPFKWQVLWGAGEGDTTSHGDTGTCLPDWSCAGWAVDMLGSSLWSLCPQPRPPSQGE